MTDAAPPIDPRVLAALDIIMDAAGSHWRAEHHADWVRELGKLRHDLIEDAARSMARAVEATGDRVRWSTFGPHYDAVRKADEAINGRPKPPPPPAPLTEAEHLARIAELRERHPFIRTLKEHTPE